MSNYITDDTRKISKDSIFLKTPQNEKFIESISKKTKIIDRDELKNYYNTNIDIIGITGTNGKTTTAAAIYSILLDMGYKVALLGTRGMFINDKQIKDKGLTTPSLLELYQDIDKAVSLKCDFFVMEVSSHAIKQERIYGLNFCLKILTNITSDHLDYHKTIQDYCKTKIQFLQNGDCPKIINIDDINGVAMRFFPSVLTYGVESKGNFFVNAYGLRNGIFAKLTFRDKKTQNNNEIHEECVLESSLFGLFNLYNLMAAILAVRIITKKNIQNICDLLKNFAGVSGRMETISKEPLIIIDFAHTTDGMQKIFESFKTKNISVVFGAGGDRDKSKRPKMGECASLYASKIYITNDNPRSEEPLEIAKDIFNGIIDKKNNQDIKIIENKKYHIKSKINKEIEIEIITNRKNAIYKAIKELPKDYVLLILGKGDECEQIFKDNKIKFNDKECVLDILDKKNKV